MADANPDPDTLHQTGGKDAPRQPRAKGAAKPRTEAEPEEITCASPPCLLGELDGTYGTY